MTRGEVRKHLPIITAFANGALIEVFQPSTNTWIPLEEPGFHSYSIYRLRPDDYLCTKCGKHSCTCETPAIAPPPEKCAKTWIALNAKLPWYHEVVRLRDEWLNVFYGYREPQANGPHWRWIFMTKDFFGRYNIEHHTSYVPIEWQPIEHV